MADSWKRYRGVGGAFSLLAGLSVFVAAAYPSLIGATTATPDQLLDGVWFVLQTVTTTGYGSLPLEAWTKELKIASIVLMLTAVPLWSYVLGEFIEMARESAHRNI